jgi:hypothetical protein
MNDLYDVIRVGVHCYLVPHDDAPWARVLATVTGERAGEYGWSVR